MRHAVGRSQRSAPRASRAQSRSMSLVEAVTNVVVGYGIALLTQLLLFPALGMHLETGQNVFIAAVFTVVSLIRSFVLRGRFEALRVRRCRRPTIAERLKNRTLDLFRNSG